MSSQAVERLSNPEFDSKFFERQYATLSLRNHIEANTFIKNFKSSNLHVGHQQFTNCFRDDPGVEYKSNSITVDNPSFTAYFSSQLSSNERLLLSNGVGASNDSQNHPDQGLPTPSQLQHVQDVLSSTVCFIQFSIIHLSSKWWSYVMCFTVAENIYSTYGLQNLQPRHSFRK